MPIPTMPTQSTHRNRGNAATGSGAVRFPLRVKSVFDPPAACDGARILVERVWPRHLSMRRARLTSWLKGPAPSAELHAWFSQDPTHWEEFTRRYRLELEANSTAIDHLRKLLRSCPVTLLHATLDGRWTHVDILASVILGTEASMDAGPPS